MLELREVTVSYGSIDALKGISLTVKKGEIVALIGANGAGKSTTLMAISGVAALRTGTIFYEGNGFRDAPRTRSSGWGSPRSPREGGYSRRMTVRENLEMGAFSGTGRELAGGHLHGCLRCSLFSLRGPGRREALSREGSSRCSRSAGHSCPGRSLLLLDEPSLGLAPIIVSRIFNIIREINERGTTVLLVEQNAKAALRLAHRAYVLETGKIVMQGGLGARKGPGNQEGVPGRITQRSRCRGQNTKINFCLVSVRCLL